MSKLALLGSAVVLYSVLALPAMAQHVTHAPSTILQNGVCPGHEAGNPYNKDEDFQGWSNWRARGGWDSRNDLSCLQEGRRSGMTF